MGVARVGTFLRRTGQALPMKCLVLNKSSAFEILAVDRGPIPTADSGQLVRQWLNGATTPHTPASTIDRSGPVRPAAAAIMPDPPGRGIRSIFLRIPESYARRKPATSY